MIIHWHRARTLVPILVALGGLIPMVAAAADPSPTTPTGAATTSRLQTAVAVGGRSVLIVHTSGSTRTLRASVKTVNVSVRHNFASMHAFSVQVKASDETNQIARLKAMPGVTGVETAVLRQFTTAVPDDPSLPSQRGYLDAVHAPEAWQIQHAAGPPQTTIAIIDSGIDQTHEDLVNKIVGTHNAVTGGTSITDTVGHGTFVAGVAAADTNNGVGVAGAGYDAGILGVKIASPDGTISIDDEVAGINWAVHNGADIINLSLGGPDFSSAEHDAVESALHAGVLVVAAAGNDGTTIKQYPAAYPGVIAVGAIDTSTHSRAPFSNFGPWVTVAAPGVGIYSTTPTAGSDFFPNTNGYAIGDGTSFASPIVAGEAALLRAQNRTMSVGRLRAAVIKSAHGYANRHLGAGLVDFARGLAHVPPTTTPTGLIPQGSKNTFHVIATSTAPTVAFRIGSTPWLPAVPVVNGVADLTVASWGFADGQHILYAVDCTSYGECNTSSASATLPLANDPPALTSPAPAATVTGLVTAQATHPGGGALRLLIGGKAYGFATTSPYTFTFSASALSDASHTMQVQLCSLDGKYCAGPISPPVTVTTAALHPRISSVYPSAISPNGDGVKDAATLTFAVPDTEAVRVDVLNSAGAVVRSTSLGTLDKGTHTWTWRGQRSGGSRLADGRYTIVLSTSRGSLRGWAAKPSLLDTSAPRLTHPSGNGQLIYPYHDGYKDTFATHTTLSGSGTVSLTIRNAHGTVVRSLRAARPKGPVTLIWNGRNNQRHVVAAGTYGWQVAVADPAGNRRHSSTSHLSVSSKRLITETVSVTKNASAYDTIGASAPCAHASVHTSQYAHGVNLTNGCPANGFELSYAAYTFKVPAAVRYTKITLQTYGRSQRHPSELTAAFQRTDGGIEVPRYQKVSSGRTKWYTIASVPAAGHVTSRRHVRLNIIVDSYYPGINDFDIDLTRLRVRLVVLK